VFDGDCAFCTSAVNVARRWITPHAEMVPWQHADLPALGLTEAICGQAVQYRDHAGRWTSAGRAIAAVLRDGPPPWSWLGRLASVPGLSRLVDRVYAWVAANRYRLPGGTPACQLQDRAA